MTTRSTVTRPGARRIAAAVGLSTVLLLAACSSGSGSATPAVVPAAASATSTGSPTPAGDTTPVVSATQAATTPPASPPPSETTACSLVSKGEIDAALGKDPGAGEPFESHGSTQCQYGTYQTTFLLVNLNPTHGRAWYDKARHNPKVQNTGDVSGVGDRAFESTEPHTTGIYFNKGDALVLVMVETFRVASPPRNAAISLAKAAAARV
jgi:hypothetical protein